MSDDAEAIRAEYQRFYDFVADCDPAIVDAWHFTENARVSGLRVKVDPRTRQVLEAKIVTEIGPDQQDQAHELAREHARKVAGVDD